VSRGEQRPAGARIPALDGIRGIAILCVMLYHFTFYSGIDPTLVVDKVYYHTALVGWFGVDLFFVLSGFLITGILYDTASAPQYFRNFYARRVLRIFPLYYGTLAVFFFLLPLVIDVSEAFEELLRDQLWYWSYLVNVQIALDYWPSFFALGHFWSLAVEEQFYLVWPLVVFFLKRRSLIAICVVCIVGAFLVRVGFAWFGNPTAAYVLTPSRADALAIGGLLALLGRGPHGLGTLSTWAWPTFVVAGAGLGAIFLVKQGLGTEDPVVVTIGFSLIAFLFGALVLLALVARPGSRRERLFSHPALAFFGRYSYALYVFHHPIAIYLGGILGVASLPRLLQSQLPGQLIFVVVATGLSLALAIPSWHFYESRFLALKRHF
jgi:peptidoglycan/LPS O-acetylase OafA/YrhL